MKATVTADAATLVTTAATTTAVTNAIHVKMTAVTAAITDAMMDVITGATIAAITAATMAATIPAMNVLRHRRLVRLTDQIVLTDLSQDSNKKEQDFVLLFLRFLL